MVERALFKYTNGFNLILHRIFNLSDFNACKYAGVKWLYSKVHWMLTSAMKSGLPVLVFFIIMHCVRIASNKIVQINISLWSHNHLACKTVKSKKKKTSHILASFFH